MEAQTEDMYDSAGQGYAQPFLERVPEPNDSFLNKLSAKFNKVANGVFSIISPMMYWVIVRNATQDIYDYLHSRSQTDERVDREAWVTDILPPVLALICLPMVISNLRSHQKFADELTHHYKALNLLKQKELGYFKQIEIISRDLVKGLGASAALFIALDTWEVPLDTSFIIGVVSIIFSLPAAHSSSIQKMVDHYDLDLLDGGDNLDEWGKPFPPIQPPGFLPTSLAVPPESQAKRENKVKQDNKSRLSQQKARMGVKKDNSETSFLEIPKEPAREDGQETLRGIKPNQGQEFIERAPDPGKPLLKKLSSGFNAVANVVFSITSPMMYWVIVRNATQAIYDYFHSRPQSDERVDREAWVTDIFPPILAILCLPMVISNLRSHQKFADELTHRAQMLYLLREKKLSLVKKAEILSRDIVKGLGASAAMFITLDSSGVPFDACITMAVASVVFNVPAAHLSVLQKMVDNYDLDISNDSASVSVLPRDLVLGASRSMVISSKSQLPYSSMNTAIFSDPQHSRSKKRKNEKSNSSFVELPSSRSEHLEKNKNTAAFAFSSEQVTRVEIIDVGQPLTSAAPIPTAI